jgi:dolichol-phosphate mannosyltransferase
LLSIIIPVFNEAENIPILCGQIGQYCQQPFEVIFVNDGSTDHTLTTIKQIAGQNPQIKCISLSRNFGHQNALMAGLEHATGQQIVMMDGDLQHPPAMIPPMLKLLHDGYDIVHTRRAKTANISWLKKTTAAVFYRFINFISDTKIEPNVADFKAFNRKVLGSLLQFKERELFLRGLFSWIGFKSTIINFEAPARQYGTTKYSYTKMLKLALRGTTSFSFKPLRLALLAGSIVSLVAFAFGIFALIAYIKGQTVPGWTSLIIAVMFLGGTQLLATGLLGEYIASLFTEAKKRPIYLIDETVNMND